MNGLRFEKNDGGRADAGYKGTSGDCVTRACAIAFEEGYRKIYKELADKITAMTGGLQTSPRDGVAKAIYHAYLIENGWTLELTKGAYLTADALSSDDKVICVLPRHLVTVINYTVHDSWDCRRDKRTKCGAPRLLGYYY